MNASLLEILLNNQTPINLNLKKHASHNNFSKCFWRRFLRKSTSPPNARDSPQQ
jgi:hypothetical protein